MHGVKRLFAWMMPRFDRSRFNVSLVSLRKKDLSEETLDALGIDITYLHKGKFDPATLTHLLKIIEDKQIDVLHLHGYGATTFGRMAGAMKKLPTILHEHANLTSTPWFQKIADRALAGSTDIALAVSESTAQFVREARLVPAERVKVVYLGAPLDEFGVPRQRRGAGGGARASRRVAGTISSIGTITRLHDSKGNEYLVDAAKQVIAKPTAGALRAGGGGAAAPGARGAGPRRTVWAIASSSTASPAMSPRVLSAFDLSVFPSLWEGTPLTAFEALAMGKAIVSTDADGLMDILDDRRAWIVPKRDADALARAIVVAMDDRRRSRVEGGRGARGRARLRHRRVRPQDGAPLRDPPSHVEGDEAPGRAARGSVVPGKITTVSSPALIDRVRDYWNTHIHDLEITRHPVGSPGFFADLDQYHFEKLHHLLRLVPFDGVKGQKVLEVGCGAGTDLVRFARGGAEVHGVDLAESAIELAKKNFAIAGLTADLRVASGEQLPFADHTFDLVYAHGVVQYTADDRALVAEARRVSSRAGW